MRSKHTYEESAAFSCQSFQTFSFFHSFLLQLPSQADEANRDSRREPRSKLRAPGNNRAAAEVPQERQKRGAQQSLKRRGARPQRERQRGEERKPQAQQK